MIITTPSVGLMPRRMWDELRLAEISDAIVRYLETGEKIPEEWIAEYNEIKERMGAK